MAREKHKTDYQVIADARGIKVGSVIQAVKRKKQYPNNPVLKALEEFRKGKPALARRASMKATKKHK